jgi:hypothetical protein
MNRAALLVLGLLAPLAAPAVAETKRYEFEVLRNGRPIGTHVAVVERRGEETRVEIAIDLAVTFGPLTLYRYKHRSTERWRGERIEAIEGETDDDGTNLSFKAWAEGDRIVLDGPEGRQIGPADAIPSSYWNRRLRTATSWIETHWGILAPIEITRGRPVVLRRPGGEVVAIPHRIESNKAAVTPLYSEAGEWVGLTFELWGASFEYVPRSPATVTVTR